MEKAIKEFIKSEGMSNNEFARKAGVSKGTISRILNGKGASIRTIKKVSNFIGKSVDELIS